MKSFLTTKEKKPVPLLYKRLRGRTWLLAICLACVFLISLASMFLSLTKEPYIIVVDSEHRLIGNITFTENVLRSEESIEGSLLALLQACYSVNSLTIYDDQAICVTYLTNAQKNDFIKSWSDTQLLQTISNSGFSSYFESINLTLKRRGNESNLWLYEAAIELRTRTSQGLTKENIDLDVSFRTTRIRPNNLLGLESATLHERKKEEGDEIE